MEKTDSCFKVNPITQGGVFRIPSNFAASRDPLTVKYIEMTFPIYLFTNKISKKKSNFFTGVPPFQALKK